ncbi:hypothetical protein BDZ91DRAFT_369887 [Kalaharituber pfeilii]|nr:hypothetical protein BDZ91DRAFT_369887 [Kalaharituber pfeilii]
MLVTMRIASNILTSRFFEGIFVPSSYGDNSVLRGNSKKSISQDELLAYCKEHNFTVPEYTMKVTSGVGSNINPSSQSKTQHHRHQSEFHNGTVFRSTAIASSISLPQPSTLPPTSEEGEGEDGQNVDNDRHHHRLSLQIPPSYGQPQKMYTCVVQFSSTELYHPSMHKQPQKFSFSTPRGVEFEEANHAKEVAARVALQALKKMNVTTTSQRSSWATVARRSAVNAYSV